MEILKSKRKGFTLIELLVIAALLSVFLSIAVPRLSIIATIREKQEIKYLYKDILYARNIAVTEKDPVTMEFNLTKNGYKIRDSEGKVFKDVKLENGVVITGCMYDTIQFATTGRTSVSETITFKTRSGDYYQITIPVAAAKIELKKVI